MKTLSQSIEMVSSTNLKGVITPIRFRLQLPDESLQVIKVDRILTRETERVLGFYQTTFRCQSMIENTMRLFELTFDLSSCKWTLSKM